ncbi:MAG: transposase [SAR324 cluster bacterium]|nr:transposase [SAR324 cluster bacterium]
MKWEDLEIAKEASGQPEIHHTNLFKAFQGWVNAGCFDKIFEESVMRLSRNNLLDYSVIHGDGTSHAAKKGGDTIGFNGHKKIKGDKVVALCDRNVNVIAPFVEAPGNRNETKLLIPGLEQLKTIFDKMGLSLEGTVMSFDGVYNSKTNRKAIFNRKMIPNINLRQCDLKRGGRPQIFDQEIYKERFRTIERLFAWEDKFKRVLIRFERISSHFYAFKNLAYTLINLRHFMNP